MSILDLVALWIGRVVLIGSGCCLVLFAIYIAANEVIDAANRTMNRTAQAIAGKDYLRILRDAVRERKATTQPEDAE